MLFKVYAISSIERNYIYVGLTSNLENRIERHNKGYEKTTKPYRPFQLIHSETHPDRVAARKHEKYLKSPSGKDFLRNIHTGLSTDR